jgi:hypothetical protein
MFQKLLERLALGLEKLSVDYMVIGGQALLLYGEPRFTRDIDITLGAGIERFPDIARLAAGFGWKALTDAPESFARKTMVYPCLDPLSGIRVDFIFSFSPYEQQAMKRVKSVSIGKAGVRFASPEDLVIHKVIAGRPRDLEDVKTVLVKNPALDVAYIQKWLGQFESALAQPFLKRFEEIQKSV